MAETVQMLVDGNAVGYTCHSYDPVLTSDGTQVQAVINFMLSIRDLKLSVPGANIIVLWDGVSWRKDVLPTYKEKRDADLTEFDTSKPMDEKTGRRYAAAVKKASTRAAYKKQGPWIQEAVRHLGIPQVTCFNYEADDLGALFADRYYDAGHPVRLVTSDGDWMQLVRNRVVWKSHRKPFTFISPMNFQEKTGFVDAAQFVEAKVLRGDVGDEVPGIPGIGEKRIAGFFQCWRSFEDFFATPSDKVDDVWRSVLGEKIPKPVKDFHEAGPSNPQIALGRTLMDLRTPNRPAPSKIATDRGAFDKPALLDLCKRLDLYRLSSDIDRFCNDIQR